VLAGSRARLVDCGVFATRPHRLAVLASGDGSNFEALALASQRGELGGQVVLLLCDIPDAQVLVRAAHLGVPRACPPAGRYRTRLEDEAPWLEVLRAYEVDTLLLAGFMRRLHGILLNAFPDRILNLHPSLLPAFPGLDAIRQAFQHGVEVTGCTVHLVDAGIDAGPIVAQEAVKLRDGDTLELLERRIHEAEHRLYPGAVRRFLGEPWRREGRRLIFAGCRAELARG
jgi:phosphoribosylglycinamide formyltransferase-1